MLEKTLESPLDSKKIKPVHPKGSQPWIFIRRTDAEAEVLILWPPNMKSWLIRKDPDAGNDWGQEKKGATENEMVGWHHWLNGHEFEQTLVDSEGQGSLACCGPWDCIESDRLSNWTATIVRWGFIVPSYRWETWGPWTISILSSLCSVRWWIHSQSLWSQSLELANGLIHSVSIMKYLLRARHYSSSLWHTKIKSIHFFV